MTNFRNHTGLPENEPELDQDYVEDDDIAEMEELEGEGQPEELSSDEMEQGPANMNENQGENQFEFHDDSVQGFFEHKEPVFDVAFNPTFPNIVISGGGDDRAYLWDRSNGETLHKLEAHSDSVIAVGFSADGKLAASGGMDGKIQIFDVSTGALVISLEGPDEVTWLQWHPRGPILLVGAADSSMWMFQLPSGQVMNVFSGHSAAVTCGAFTPDGKHIVTGSEDATLILWDPKLAKAIWRLTAADARFHQSAITNLSISDDSTLILSGSVDSTVKLIRLASGEIVSSFENHSDSVETIGFAHSMALAATGSVDGKINIWDTTTLRLRQTCTHEDSVIKLIWHPTAPFIFSCSVDHTVCMWDARTGECARKWQGHQDSVLALALSPDGNFVVTGSDDGNSLVFQA